MKKIISFILIFYFLISPILFILDVDAITYVTGSTTGATKIKNGPGNNYIDIAVLSLGTTVNLISTTKITSEKGCSAGWYKINYNDTVQYICSSNVNIANETNHYYTSPSWTYRTTANSLSVRSKASTSGTYITALSFGTEVNLISVASSGNGCSNSWYKVSYHNNQTGYICSTYVSKYSNITSSDEEYNTILKNAGFPESYWPYLTYLHKLHPTWTFNAIQTKMTFKKAVDGEEGKNLMQTSIASYKTSSTPAEGTSWYRVTTGVIAYYLDSRNFLTEKTIFMFENLGYDEEHHTYNVVKSVMGDGKLSDDLYINAFVTAGINNKISPVHLASRVRQEVGADGGTATSGAEFTWNGKTYSGYYNFFNIGAYGTNPVIRGLAYAAGLLSNTSYGVPWNTVEKAINGGASFLANSYINKGQYTLYFQKFNVSPTASNSSYTHQYMTNVNAPTAEGMSTYSSYDNIKILDTPFVFSIPVYQEMPDDVVTLPPVGDTDNNLSNITINGISLYNFDSDVIEYNYNVSNNLNNVTISSTASSSKATISGNGEYTLENDATNIQIIVTSETGSTKTYNITINKVEPTNLGIEEIMILSNLKMDNGFVTGIQATTTAAKLISTITEKVNSITIQIKNAAGVLKTSEILATGDTITITKSDNTTNTFTIAIKGDVSGDGKISILDLLQVQKHLLKYTTLTNNYKVAADANYDGNVTILDLLLIQKHILGYSTIK